MTMPRRTPTLLLTLVLTLLAGAALWLAPVGCDRRPDGVPAGNHEAHTGYHCPMHPQVRSDKPGKCHICGMELVPDEPGASAAPAQGGGSAHQHGQDRAPGAGGAERGARVFTVPPEKRQLIGVKLASVTRRPLARAIRTVGRVELDERKVVHLHTKVEGWIERLYVNTTGQRIRRGDPLYTVYSPKLLATQREYQLALRGRRALSGASTPEARAAGDAMVASARRRLDLWDVEPAQVRALERGAPPSKLVTFHSPLDGVVIEKMAVEGLRVDPGTDLLTVADLSTVWVTVSIFEHEIPLVREGQEATITLPYLPGTSLRGKVVYVYPTLDEKTRTVRARIELPNPEGALKPMMYADVSLESPMGEVLAVPQQAVLDSGLRKVVFVDRGEGRFEPREVRVGRKAEGHFEVLSGLEEGERVAATATFMLDAESKLGEAAGGTAVMPGMSDSKTDMPGTKHRH
jgi:Cu(I)/Ag(I) efflux system membrane fusion protein